MTKINAKTIGTRDVQALYDIMIEAFKADPTAIAADSTPVEHTRQIMAQELANVGYPMAANLTRILDSYEAKLKNNGAQPASADNVNENVAAMFSAFTGNTLNRKASAQTAQNQATATPTTGADAADETAETTASEIIEAKDEKITMAMNNDFTIADDKVDMINTTLGSATNQAATSFPMVLAALSASEDAAQKAAASNASVSNVIKQYDAGKTDVDEGTIQPPPQFEVSGLSNLAIDSPMVAVLDTLISQGVTPEITFAEAIGRIKSAEEAVANARLEDKALQRNLRRARPKDSKSLNIQIANVDVDNVSVADELNAHVQIAEQVASDVFTNSYGATASILGFDIPTLEFDAAHPDVPAIDETFRFYSPVLCEALHTIAENEIMWLHGDSGCGKSEFWAQVSARLNMPFTRMNLDGHLTRSDIIGVNRMLPNEDKQMEMRFVEGILPRAMARPGIMLLDEFDLGDPEIMPIFQPVLEGKPLVLLEDGGRIVHPHPLFRIAITGNTIGLGSANQMYNNAFEQSAATRDRISSFVPMPYMTPEIEKDVVMARVPDADEMFIEKLIQLANRVREGFKAGEIHQIFSTRAVLYSAKRFARYADHFPTPEDAADEILRTVILGRMDQASHNVVKGLIDNIFE